MRRGFQDNEERELVAGVQELTGREVVAFFSANHLDPDAAVESFLMAPRAEDQTTLAGAIRNRGVSLRKGAPMLNFG